MIQKLYISLFIFSLPFSLKAQQKEILTLDSSYFSSVLSVKTASFFDNTNGFILGNFTSYDTSNIPHVPFFIYKKKCGNSDL